MKKLFFTIVFSLTLGFLFTSCKEEKKATETKATEVTEKSENTEKTTTEAKELAAAVYQCPMDCEHSKTYDKPGKCPVCKMELKKVKAKVATESEEVNEHAGHDHD